MKISKAIILIAALLFIAIADSDCNDSPYNDPKFVPRKGTTYSASQWPNNNNQWTGQMGCNGCNPKQGDTQCSVKLPLLCIIHWKKLDRPYYYYQPESSSYNNQDGGFYNSWTGGVFAVTDSFQGYSISSFAQGDSICKEYYGQDAKFAEFHDGYYLDDMNGAKSQVVKAWGNWNWALAKCGQWSLWGYFNLHWKGRVWIWVKDQPFGNCGL